MKIDIAKEDLWWIRNVVSNAIYQMENCPNPAAHSRAPQICRKLNRKLNRAIKKAYGHDMMASNYNS